MGLTHEEAFSTIRFSLSIDTAPGHLALLLSELESFQEFS
jgi:hypothetical protein